MRAGAEEWNFAFQWWLLYQPTWEISDKGQLPESLWCFLCNYTKNTLLLRAAANKWLVRSLFLRSIFSKTSQVRWQFQ